MMRPAKLVYLQRWQGTGWETQAREVAAICARFQPWRILADGNSIGDPLAGTLQTEIRAALGPGQTAGTVERFTFGAESKGKLIDRLTLGLSARAVQYPAHRVLLSELRAFEYGAAGSSGRAKMGARARAHDDVVIALALAWFAAPDAPPTPMRERVLLGSQVGAGQYRLSVDRAKLCGYNPNLTRQGVPGRDPETFGVVSMPAGEVRAIPGVADIVPDPIINDPDLPDNPAHALICVSYSAGATKSANQNIFKNVRQELAAAANRRPWEIDPPDDFPVS